MYFQSGIDKTIWNPVIFSAELELILNLFFPLVISCINKQTKENEILWVRRIFVHMEAPCAVNTANLAAAQSSLVSICPLWCWTVEQAKNSVCTQIQH